MTSSGLKDSPLGVVEELAGSEAVESFEALGHETRLAILVALWDAYDPLEDQNALGFSDLRRRVGYSDPGNFRYHLDKLTGTLIEHSEDGYSLRNIGLKLVQTVIGGSTRDVSMDLREIPIQCHMCGGATGVTYQDGELYQVCLECEGMGRNQGFPTGTLFREPFPPAGLVDRTPEEIYAAGRFQLNQIMGLKAGGICPVCSGPIESGLTICDDHDVSTDGVCEACGNRHICRVNWVCSNCKYRGSTSPLGIGRHHPSVIAFLYDHGIDYGYGMSDFETLRRNHELVEKLDRTVELISTDPIRFAVTYRSDGDELRLTMDEDMAVLESDRRAN